MHAGKNQFVLDLRDYLKRRYVTKHCSTTGEGDYEAKKVNGSYALVRRNPNKPKEFNGFYFRKDLCLWPPQSVEAILEEVGEFSKSKDLESRLEDDKLRVRVNGSSYLVTPYIDKGHAGEIGVQVVES